MKPFRFLKVAFIGAAAIAAQAPSPGRAADPIPPSGFYAGAHMGYLFGNANATLADPTGGVASASGASPYGTLAGGVQAGYQWIAPSRWMLGLEADLGFANFRDLGDVLSYRATGTGTANEQLEFLGSLRGRVGYTFGGWTPFLTGGLAFASTRFSRTDLTTGNEDATSGQWRLGYTVGGGLDYMIDPRWSARLEYLYTNLGLRGFGFAAPAAYYSQYSLNEVRVGLNYHFGVPGKADDAQKDADEAGPGTWEVHGQTTFILQGYAPFGAAYSGQNSLPPEGQSRETWTSSLYFGMRLWKGGELYFNPELLQGYGVANTTGAAGYPNGEAQKSNFPFPRFNVSRLFLRQEFGLGGETETIESDYGQLAGKKDISRVTLQIGKFSVHDIFDTNDYAQDPRIDFLNWSIWAAGAFDYPADRVGLTYGVTAELNRPAWAVRAGYFLVGNEPNANVFDWALFARGGYVAEGELRYKAFDHPGVFKVGPWLTSTFSGSYSEAVALANATPGLTANDTVAQTRQGRVKYGVYTNLQQEVSKDLGAFARWSWNSGQNETSAFTDINQSVSFGAQLKGAAWGREDDVVGLGVAFNTLSASAASYLAAGGMGVIVGDGALSYASENVIETYYALQFIKGITGTVDYQLLVNPAYNTVRGPVNVFSARLHAAF
ncbi:MAG: carbohydrate porin [Proteobacteria bacterium]|nr:carbohydrate porin [Pseudomonadota bacterium]